MEQLRDDDDEDDDDDEGPPQNAVHPGLTHLANTQAIWGPHIYIAPHMEAPTYGPHMGAPVWGGRPAVFAKWGVGGSLSGRRQTVAKKLQNI